ncbi:GTPase-activating protein gyp7 [Smittium mucronatum]|uniref:GTPase-activating protein gyp7 n=1 Tax=Smittium mucronatum TaxID=133383 RepID=A0A1R0GY97_9FUNG|nr:GTPase-activating protein gyp7 [Smittium mucronatum]
MSSPSFDKYNENPPAEHILDSSDLIPNSIFTNTNSSLKKPNDLGWNVLQKFSHLTKAIRDFGSSALELSTGKQLSPYLPSSFKEFANSRLSPSISDSPGRNASSSVEADSGEYESGRVYLAQWASQHILRRQQELNDLELTGMKESLSGDGYDFPTFLWDEFSKEEGDLGDFDLINDGNSSKIPKPLRTKLPLSPQKWTGYFYKDGILDSSGRLQCDKRVVLKDVFSGGIDEDIRPVVWKFLLGIYPWDSSESERINIDKINSEDYYTRKSEWLSNKEITEGSDFLEQKTRIEKDVLRTDRELPTFATDDMTGTDEQNIGINGLPGSNASLEHLKDILLTYHYTDTGEDDEGQKLGYVQGMSDLLSPLYVVIQDEASTYACFVKFMKRMRRNFFRDQSGMTEQLSTLTDLIRVFNYPLYKHLESAHSSNLFCCYRWLLIWFKREFEFEDVLKLWEVLWTDYLSPDFFILVAFGILQRHSDVIMDHLQRFDEILKYVNGLSGGISLNVALKDAEVLFYVLRHQLDILDSNALALNEGLVGTINAKGTSNTGTLRADNISGGVPVDTLVDLGDEEVDKKGLLDQATKEESAPFLVSRASGSRSNIENSEREHQTGGQDTRIPDRVRSVFYP